jgi:hypothetical protein
MQQTRIGVMRWTIAIRRRMTFGRLRIAEDFLGRNQEMDVVEFVALGWVHAPKYKRVMPTA